MPPLHRWLNDPELMQHWDGRDKPKSMEWIVSHYRPMIDGTDPTECYMIEADGRTIGFIYSRLDPMPDTQHTRAEIDIMIGEADQWDKGYGTDAIRALLGHLFDHKRVHRVYLIPRATNARAIRCYQKCGFVKEGTIRHDDFVEGQWVDGVMMSILEDEYGESHR